MCEGVGVRAENLQIQPVLSVEAKDHRRDAASRDELDKEETFI